MTDLGASGFWNDLADPRAVYYNGKTYLSWITTTGSIMVASYTHATGVLSTPFAMSTTASGEGTPDVDFEHMSVSLCVRASDHRIVAVYNRQHIPCYRRISTNPEDVTSWGAAGNVMETYAQGYLGYQFGSLCQVADGTLYYVTWRLNLASGVRSLSYSTSADGGATWSAGVDLLTSVSGNMYWHAFTVGAKVHIFTTDTNREVGWQSSIWHVYVEGATLYKSDGTQIAGPYPVSITTGTKVQQGGPPLGSVRVESWGIEGTTPVVVLASWDFATAVENLIHVAQWNGAAWIVTQIVGTVGIVGSNKYQSSAAMVRNDPGTLYIPRKVGGVFELFRYVSRDHWATWTVAQITSDSPANNIRPDAPLNAEAGMILVWPQGTFTNGNTWDFGLQFLGTSWLVADYPAAWFTANNLPAYVSGDTLTVAGQGYAAARAEWAIRPPSTGLVGL